MAQGAGAGRSAAVCPWARLDGGGGGVGVLVMRADLCRAHAQPPPVAAAMPPPLHGSHGLHRSTAAWSSMRWPSVVEEERTRTRGR